MDVRLACCGLLAVLLVGGCAAQRPAEIRDVLALPQDAAAYLGPDADAPLLTTRQHAAEIARLHAAWFAPWIDDSAPPATAVAAMFDKVRQTPGFGPNGREIDAAWLAALRQSAALDKYPSASRRGYTNCIAHLRELPTDRPRFERFTGAGEGFPFDTLQSTALWPLTPVRVLHATARGRWLYVRTPLASGWLPAAAVMDAPDDVCRRWVSQPLAAVRDDDDAAPTRIGMLLPARDGWPVAKAAALPPPTPRAIAAVANGMLGQPYGWGGMYGDRDCSATTHDIMAAVGIWLPRNSGEQAQAGRKIPLEHLSPADRERQIIAQGVPMLTLVNLKGHVALYIGVRDGRAIILHNFWGIRTTDGGDGRFIVGRCAITTLQPGIELPNVRLPEGDMRARVLSMTILGGVEPKQPAGTP
jgi:cell wall-associated NlpC family hydrolase